MNITITTIPHAAQRYATAGDWYFPPKGGDLTICVSKMPDHRFELLVAVHELIEALACQQAGITTAEVDQFDMTWDSHGKYLEPGLDPRAPYHVQHMLANFVEAGLADVLGVDQTAYAEALEALG